MLTSYANLLPFALSFITYLICFSVFDLRWSFNWIVPIIDDATQRLIEENNLIFHQLEDNLENVKVRTFNYPAFSYAYLSSNISLHMFNFDRIQFNSVMLPTCHTKVNLITFFLNNNLRITTNYNFFCYIYYIHTHYSYKITSVYFVIQGTTSHPFYLGKLKNSNL